MQEEWETGPLAHFRVQLMCDTYMIYKYTPVTLSRSNSALELARHWVCRKNKFPLSKGEVGLELYRYFVGHSQSLLNTRLSTRQERSASEGGLVELHVTPHFTPISRNNANF